MEYTISEYDIFIGVIFWIVFAFIVQRNKSKADLEDQRFYVLNFYYSSFFAITFSIIYYFAYGGGDCLAYYQSSKALNKLMLINFSDFYNQMFFDYIDNYHLNYFDHVNYPPGWIFRERESFFVAKIMSFFSLFTFNSFIALTIVMSYLSAMSSWFMYKFIKSNLNHNLKYLRIAFLFIPSVNFWCSGLTKDTVIYISLMFIIPNLLNLINDKIKLSRMIPILVFSWVVLNIREFLLIAVYAPYAYIVFKNLIGSKNRGFIVNLAVQVFLLAAILGLSFLFFFPSIDSMDIADSFFKEAELVQQDFMNNKAYGNKRYYLDQIDFSIAGILTTSPQAISIAIYRPFIWEALSPTLLVNGIESMLLIYLTIVFWMKGSLNKIKNILSNNILFFSLILIVLIALMTGITSVLFGVLVRLRAPILPFVIVLLTVPTAPSITSPKMNP